MEIIINKKIATKQQIQDIALDLALLLAENGLNGHVQ